MSQVLFPFEFASVKTTQCVFKLWAHSYWPAVTTSAVQQHEEVTDTYCDLYFWSESTVNIMTDV